VSFGPFQLGELAEGAVEEVRTRVLREQLGARLVALSGADFSTPIAEPAHASTNDRHPSRLPPIKSRVAPQGDGVREFKSLSAHRSQPKPASHSWRAREEERAKKPLQRKFHGSRRDDERPRKQPAGEVRADVLTDRKGRPILVARLGQAPPKERPQERPATGASKRGRRGRRTWPDRASGPRPSRPRERR
jgi:23S rRNA pseudouridine2605 synthase